MILFCQQPAAEPKQSFRNLRLYRKHNPWSGSLQTLIIVIIELLCTCAGTAYYCQTIFQGYLACEYYQISGLSVVFVDWHLCSAGLRYVARRFCCRIVGPARVAVAEIMRARAARDGRYYVSSAARSPARALTGSSPAARPLPVLHPDQLCRIAQSASFNLIFCDSSAHPQPVSSAFAASSLQQPTPPPHLPQWLQLRGA